MRISPWVILNSVDEMAAAASSCCGIRKKQTALSLEFKMKLLAEVDAKVKSKSKLCKEYNIANSTLSTILKNREKITAAYESKRFESRRKRMRCAKHKDVDSALRIWYGQAVEQNLPITVPILMEKADSLASDLGIDFKSNPGWIERFKARNGLVLKKEKSTGGGDKTVEATSEVTDTTLPGLLMDYSAGDIFCAHEIGLYHRCLPHETQSYKGERHFSCKKSEERVTVLIACNANGSEKLPLLVVGKHREPRSFGSVKTLPVHYSSNPKACMTSRIFTDWIKCLDRRFQRENREVAMILTDCPAHPRVDTLQAVKLVFLPADMNSVFHPCNQGITQNFKFRYRSLLMQKHLACIEAKEEIKFSILDCLHLMCSAWHAVTSRTIENCFLYAGMTQQSCEEQPSSEDDDLPTNIVFERIKKTLGLSADIGLADYMAVDDGLIAVTDCNSTSQECSQDDEGAVSSVPSAGEVLEGLACVRRYLESQVDSGRLFFRFYELEQYVERTVLFNPVQKKITDFFQRI